MGVIGGPNIVEHKTEGNDYRLEIVYDAASVRSYPGSGTVWKNLGKLSRDKDGTLTNGPTFSDERSFLDSFGYFSFDGTNDHVLFDSTTLGDGAWTIELWAWTENAANYNLFSNSSGGPVTNSGGISSQKMYYRNYDGSWNANQSNETLTNHGNFIGGNINYWNQLVFANQADSEMSMYNNGVKFTPSDFNSETSNGGPINAVARNWFSYFNGDIAIFRYSSGTLSDKQIRDNYENYKRRFDQIVIP